MNHTATPSPAARARDFEARLLTPANREALTRAGATGQNPGDVIGEIIANLDTTPPPAFDEYVRANAIPERAAIRAYWLGCSEKIRSFTPGEIFAAGTSPAAIARVEASQEFQRLTRPV